MKKLVVLFIVSLILTGCYKKGSKGDPGVPGGTGRIVTIEAPVPDYHFVVEDPRISHASTIAVYLSLEGNLISLPYFNPFIGVNTYAIINQNTGSVEFFNVQSIANTKYVIVLEIWEP